MKVKKIWGIVILFIAIVLGGGVVRLAVIEGGEVLGLLGGVVRGGVLEVVQGAVLGLIVVVGGGGGVMAILIIIQIIEKKVKIESEDWDENIFRKLTRISSVMVALTSLGTIAILSFFFSNVSQEYFRLVHGGTWILLLYPLLNLFADSFSVHETRWILRKVEKVSLLWLLPLLGLDLVLSAGIFLLIPMGASTFTNVFQAMIFQGEQPYLGILFWSTFSTSAMFYLFIISSVVTSFLYTPLKIALSPLKFLNIDRNPVNCMGIVLILLTTMVFV